MLTHISPKLATLIRENAELQNLLKFLIQEANLCGQKGQSVSKILVHIKKKNLLLLRFFDESWIEWDENC